MPGGAEERRVEAEQAQDQPAGAGWALDRQRVGAMQRDSHGVPASAMAIRETASRDYGSILQPARCALTSGSG